MRIAVIAAAGRTGSLLVAELLRRGHDVSALVRHPEKLGALADQVQVVAGGSTDPAALDQLLAGADVVVSALGPDSRTSTVVSETARALVPAMQRAGVQRFIGISGAGTDVPGDRKGAKDRAISRVVKAVGGAMAADKAAEYRIWADSDVDFTLVRPPRLVDGPPTGAVAHDPHTPGRSSSIRRSDLAVFLADEVEQARYPRLAPFVCGG